MHSRTYKHDVGRMKQCNQQERISIDERSEIQQKLLTLFWYLAEIKSENETLVSLITMRVDDVLQALRALTVRMSVKSESINTNDFMVLQGFCVRDNNDQEVLHLWMNK